ncbi:MAG: redox-sensing transcriptional repressor Rex [Thermoflexales bacterium]|nr:redox-sensing transcriptional repressor Rex [Thermoflexales bacterium]
MAFSDIPDIVIGRLPVYLRALAVMATAGQEITSSHELGEKLGISSAQIRKDLSHFGEFGKQGTGYRISHLQDQLRRILKVDREWPVALIGLGDIGHAIARYGGFKDRGFVIKLVFDSDPTKIGQSIGNLLVQDVATLPDIVREQGVQIAMLAVTAKAAQDVADLCVKGGIRAILNYAPINLAVPATVRVQYLDPVTHLQRMTYYLE